MTALFPHRKMWFQHTIQPATHGGAVVGDWVDHRYYAASSVAFKITVSAAAGPITFTFETADGDASGLVDLTTVRQMGNCDICDDTSVSYEDATITVDPTAEPFLTDGFVTAVFVICCPGRFVRALSTAGGNYTVEVIGLARNLARA